MKLSTRLALTSCLIIGYDAHANLLEVTIDSQKPPVSSRARFGGASGGAKLKLLEQLKLAALTKDPKKCAAAAQSARALMNQIEPWGTLLEVSCLLENTELPKEHFAPLTQALERLKKNQDTFMVGPQSERARQLFVQAEIKRLQNRLKYAPRDAIKIAENLLTYLEWANSEQKAEIFRLSGELAFLEQRLQAAKRYFERSLDEKSDDKLRSRLSAIEAALQVREKKDTTESIQPISITVSREESLEASEKENKAYDRMKLALKSGDLVAAVEDGMEIIENFGGGVRADWAADRIEEIFLNLATKSEQNFVLIRNRILKQMHDADAQRLKKWASAAFRQASYLEAKDLGEKSLKKSEGVWSQPELLLMVARSSLYIGAYRDARSHFSELVFRYAGTSEARVGLFHLGLLAYRNRDFTSAVAHLERLLVLPKSEDLELETRYWLWRSLQNIDETRADQERSKLADRFPLTYYGLRARAEKNSGVIDFSFLKETKKIESKLWMTTLEKKRWDRFLILLSAGWWEEAQIELSAFNFSKDPNLQALSTLYSAAAFDYPKAIRTMNSVWEKNLELFRPPFTNVAFPKEFLNDVVKEANKRKINPDVARALMRQESAFNFRAVSRSNALGLMQMIPPTAQEVASELGVKIKLPDDLFDPVRNIEFCVYYLAKLLGQFEGSVPMAVASYNAGPTRVKKWLELRGIKPSKTSNPDDEIWMEEMPWSETRFYVKAILRNMILYRVLDGGRVQLSEPIWKPE